MNRSKHPLNNKLSKKINKEVYKAQKQYASPEQNADSDRLTASEMLKKFPKKASKKETSLLSSVKKKIQVKKLASKKTTSKRTSPGKTATRSAPASPHKEGARWVKTLAKQSKIQRKSLQKRMTKKKG